MDGGYFKGLGMLPLILEESEMAAGPRYTPALCIPKQSLSTQQEPPLTAQQTHTQANNGLCAAAQPE